MTLRDIYILSDDQLANEATELAAAITASPTTFGLTVPIATTISDAAEVFVTSLTDWHAAQNAVTNASFVKTSQRESLLSTLSTYLNLMYATPTVTGSAITSLGLAPRSETRTPVIPFQPQDLLATPFADGTVKITWSRGDNKYGVVYQIEAAGADATEWAMIQSTTKTKVTLSGMNPGTPMWFRVRATKGTLASEYSFPSGIYIPMPGGTGTLELAA